MNIQAERQRIIQRVAQVEDAHLIQAINSLLDYGIRQEGYIRANYWANGMLIAQEDLEGRIKIAEQEIENGHYLTIDQLKKESESW